MTMRVRSPLDLAVIPNEIEAAVELRRDPDPRLHRREWLPRKRFSFNGRHEKYLIMLKIIPHTISLLVKTAIVHPHSPVYLALLLK
jgi:hypothetical protein